MTLPQNLTSQPPESYEDLEALLLALAEPPEPKLTSLRPRR